MEERDFIGEMANAIDKAIPESGDFISSLLAIDLVESLRREDPSLLMGWLYVKAPGVLADVISRRSNQRRQIARWHGPRQAFEEAVKRFESTGDRSELSPFQTEYVIDDANTRRRVADMTGADYQFVAKGYARTKNMAGMLEAFNHAMAKKVGDRRTAEVMDEETYLRMYRSIVTG